MNPRSALSPTLLLVVLLTSGCAGNQPNMSDSRGNRDLPAPDYLGAVGIGVSDLEASTQFYETILGLTVLRTYELGYIRETVLGHPNATGAVLVLMHWPGDTERRYDGSDVKNVFYVGDPKAVIERIRTLGGQIDREATPHPAVNGALVGLGRDPDNYVVEVLEKPRP